jgi:hypothetical protein
VPQHLCEKLISHVFLNVLFSSIFFLLYLKQSYFFHLSLYIYIPRDIFAILFSITFVSFYFPLARGNPDFYHEKRYWLERSPDSQSGSLLRCQRGPVKESMVPGGGFWCVWLHLYHHLELDCPQSWRNKLDKQIENVQMSVHLSNGIHAHAAEGVAYSTFLKCLNLWFLLSAELPWQQYIISSYFVSWQFKWRAYICPRKTHV